MSKKFEEMDAEDAFVILAKMSELIHQSGGGGIADFAQRITIRNPTK